MYIYIYVCMYIYIYISRRHIYIHIYIYMCVCVYIYIYHEDTFLCIYICAYVYIYTHTHRGIQGENMFSGFTMKTSPMQKHSSISEILKILKNLQNVKMELLCSKSSVFANMCPCSPSLARCFLFFHFFTKNGGNIFPM